jgi:hypothetical protein
MGQSQVAMRRPQWVARDVLHNDRFTAGGGCSAGAGRWSNCHAVDRIGIGPWKARRGATPQAIAVQQRDGRENATGLLLHESAYAIKDFGERIPPGHHLEDPSLHDEDGFSACAFRAQHPFRTASRCFRFSLRLRVAEGLPLNSYPRAAPVFLPRSIANSSVIGATRR